MKPLLLFLTLYFLLTSCYAQNPDNYQHFRLSLNGGPSYRTAKISGLVSDTYKDYTRNLKWGVHLSGDATWFINENTGLGIKYSRFTAYNEMEGGGYGYGYGYSSMSDDIAISFIGPMFSSRNYFANKRNALFCNLALGYLGYKDEEEYQNAGLEEISGSTLGVAGDLGYQLGLSKSLSLGLMLSYTAGILSKVKVSSGGSNTTIDLDDDEKENLGRIDLSLGLVFHL